MSRHDIAAFLWDAFSPSGLHSSQDGSDIIVDRHAHCTPLLAFWGFNGRAGDTTMDAGPYQQDLDLSGGYEAKWNDYHEVTWAQQGALSRFSLPSILWTFQIHKCS